MTRGCPWGSFPKNAGDPHVTKCSWLQFLRDVKKICMNVRGTPKSKQKGNLKICSCKMVVQRHFDHQTSTLCSATPYRNQ